MPVGVGVGHREGLIPVWLGDSEGCGGRRAVPAAWNYIAKPKCLKTLVLFSNLPLGRAQRG